MKILSFLIFASLMCGGSCSVFVDQTIIYPSNGSGAPAFGFSVASSSDGTRVLVGAYQANSYEGLAYVFDVNSSNQRDWTESAVLSMSNFSGYPVFGSSVALTPDGMRALVGAPADNTVGNSAGSVFVYDDVNSGDWAERAILYPVNTNDFPYFGVSVAISSDGSRLIIGAQADSFVDFLAGAAYIFDLNAGNPSDWIRRSVLYPTTVSRGTDAYFGRSVAISSDGSRVLIGAYSDDTLDTNAGAAFVFDVNPGNASAWTLQTILFPNNGTGSAGFGQSVAISSDGSRALVGAYQDDTFGANVGAAYVFDVNPSNTSDWTEQNVLGPSNFTGLPSFGWSVAISSNGNRALIGAVSDDTFAQLAGAAFVFDESDPTTGDWVERSIIYPANNGTFVTFGQSVALSSDGSQALVGSYGDDRVGSDAGAVYVMYSQCPDGNIIAIVNGTACQPCPSGQVPNVNQTACIPLDGNETQSDQSSENQGNDGDGDGDGDDGLSRGGIIGLVLAEIAVLFFICFWCITIPCLMILAVICVVRQSRSSDEHEEVYPLDTK